MPPGQWGYSTQNFEFTYIPSGTRNTSADKPRPKEANQPMPVKTHSRRYLAPVAALALVFLMQASPAAAQTRAFSMVAGVVSPEGTPTPLWLFLDSVGRELFRRLEIEATLTALPAERALINVNSGLDDVDLFRPPGIEKRHPNLIMVPERVIDMDFVAYTKRADIKIRKPEDLHPYTVGIPNGWFVVESRLKSPNEFTRTPTFNELYNLISKDRIDVIILTRYGGPKTVNSEAQVRHLIAHEPPLVQSGMFMYMNKKHAALVPRLAQALKDMKTDGSYKKILDATLYRMEAK
jgi:polar amino acid transport system substrate-binding protein